MHQRSSLVSSVAFLASLSVSSTAYALGLGNVAYTQQEVQTPIAYFNQSTFGVAPAGSNTALVLRDVMVVMGSNDSGKPPGALHVFDITNPRVPRKLRTLVNTPETLQLREQHAMPVAIIDGKDIIVMPSLTGITFFDFTDVMNPTPVGTLSLEGVNGGDYDNAAWQISWSWPYVYVGGTGNGVYVVDATNPAMPRLAKRILAGDLGSFRVGPVHAAGNYIVVSGMDQGPSKVSVLDVSDPAAPLLLTTGTAPAEMYSAVVIGDRIFGAGANGQYSFLSWSPSAVSVIAQKQFGSDKGGYCTYQDGFAFCGQSSEGFRKVDMRNEANIVEVFRADIPNSDAADTDFATVMGNLVYLGNDHGTGAALIPHSMTPDMTPPKVQKAYPNDGQVNQPITTRITVFFSDEIDIASINSANLTLRKTGGSPLDGVFSHSSFNAVSFGPRQPLEPNSTYEIVVPSGGLNDLSGNKLVEPVTVRFSTGPTLDPPGPGTGGAGGMGAGGAAGSGGNGMAGDGVGGDAGSGIMAGAGGVAGSGTPSVGGGLGGDFGNGGMSAVAGASSAGTSSAGMSSAGANPGGAGTLGTGGVGAGGVGTGGSNAAGTSSGASGGGPGTGTLPPEDPNGCGCSVPGRPSQGGYLALLALSWAALRRARRKPATHA